MNSAETDMLHVYYYTKWSGIKIAVIFNAHELIKRRLNKEISLYIWQ